MKKIALISGSYSLTSRLNGLAEYAQSYFGPRTRLDVIHVHQLPAGALISADYKDPEIIGANNRVAESDGVIVTTPIFKASFSGILKTYLDLLPQHALDGKVVLPLALGGSPAHVLAIKYALEPVLSELGAQHIIQGAYTVDHQVKRAKNGRFEMEREAARRLERALRQFEENLQRQPESSPVISH